MSLLINHETPHNDLWYTPTGSSKPTAKRTDGTNRIPSLTPDQYISLIRHHYRHDGT